MKIYDITLKRLILKLKREARRMLSEKDRMGREDDLAHHSNQSNSHSIYMVFAWLSPIRMEQSLKKSPKRRKPLGLK